MTGALGGGGLEPLSRAGVVAVGRCTVAVAAAGVERRDGRVAAVVVEVWRRRRKRGQESAEERVSVISRR